MRILLVEDDAMIGRNLDKALSSSGMAVDWVRNGADCEAAARETEYDVLLLDLGLPDADGFDILSNLRRSGTILPVVIITAREDIGSRIVGLDKGADDYVVKPFDFDELNARIRAVVRRSRGLGSSEVVAGAIALDLARFEVTYRGRSAVLPAKEFSLLRTLAERPGTIFSRGQIEDRLYDWGKEVESNAVDVLIHYIRRRFDKEIIRNIRGIGWMVPG